MNRARLGKIGRRWALSGGWLGLWSLGSWLGLAADPPEVSVPLPPGETRLTDLGLYQVSWQSYGREPVRMPLSWQGHFEPAAGVSYQAWGRLLGREALLMHSPWQVPPGKTWVDYSLVLPRMTPIRLTFGIAMGPEAAQPNRSDGVTFSCLLSSAGREQELMREHHRLAQWRDYSFDLSAYAGQTVGVRLQVEPGPQNNASFDFSYFGDARLVVGSAPPDPSGVLRQLTSSRAYQAHARASATGLCNTATLGVAPSNLLPARNQLEAAGPAWRFSYIGADARVTYVYEPRTGTLEDFTVQVDDGRPFLPAMSGGATVAPPGSDQPLAARGGRARQVTRRGDELDVTWEYEVAGRPLRIAWTFQMRGKALLVAARSEAPWVSQFFLGEVAAPVRRTLRVPYLEGSLSYLPIERVFVGRYLDWTRSQASTCPQGQADYHRKTDGARNPLLEFGYMAVSPDLGEVLPNVPYPPSNYRGLLGPRIVLDIWGHHRGTYRGDAEVLRALKDHGVDYLVVLQHDWQRFGYDVKLPDHLPANPRYGGDEGLIAFGQAANDCGYPWALHENYIDLYPDAPSYDPAARVLEADGSPSKAWFNPGTGVQSFGLKCNRALEFARRTSPEIKRRYRTTASYHDVNSCVPPWHQLDHEAGQPLAAMARAKVAANTELFEFFRRTHEGPHLGEGANHFYWAGLCDGVEAQVVGGEDHTPLLDFDLLKLHPQMVNHGMGYYERWFRRGYETRWGRDAGSVEQIDKYRAQELAYGHAGFIGAVATANLQWILREHHLMHPVQRLYGAARPVEIRYEVEGQFVSGGVAWVMGQTTRQRVRYDSGLTVWVNWRPEPWTIEAESPPGGLRSAVTAGRRRVLPQWGFLALGPDTEVWTALRDDRWADYAESPEFIFADARTCFPLPYLRPRRDIEPRLRSFEPLGGDRARVTYEWRVQETLPEDYACFVHATHPDAPGGEHIVFQQDHPLPKPTSQWRPGEVVIDGPHELRISPRFDAYDLTMGLFKGERVWLRGACDAADRIVVARLKVDRQDGQVVRVSAEPGRPEAERPSAGEADFSAHQNPVGTWIDFGPVATDGALKVQRAQDALVVFPYPRERALRIALHLRLLAPRADRSRVQVRALAAETQQDLGPVEFKLEGDWLVWAAGGRGVGRYVVRWK